MPLYVPGVELLVVEFSEIEIVEESLVDCMCFSDMVKSLISLISSSEALFLHGFSGISVLLVAFLKELLVSLGSNVSEMLEISI